MFIQATPAWDQTVPGAVVLNTQHCWDSTKADNQRFVFGKYFRKIRFLFTNRNMGKKGEVRREKKMKRINQNCVCASQQIIIVLSRQGVLSIKNTFRQLGKSVNY